MADKGSTWLNGVGIITYPQPEVQPRRVRSSATSRAGRIAWTMLIVGAVSAYTALVLNAAADSWAGESVRILGLAVVLLFSMAALSRSPKDRWKTAFVVWGLVLISECIFFRSEGEIHANVAAFQGRFPAAAYSEVVGWVVCFVTLLVLLAPVRQRVRSLFAGDYKWLMFFSMVCVASCAYAPRPIFGLAWAFKLCLVTLVLSLCAIQIRDLQHTVSFLCFTFFAYTVVVLQPVILGFATNSLFDEEGRMSTIVNPDALSADAAAVFVLALTLFSRVKGEGLRRSAIVFGAVGFVVMILAGGKAGIVSGLFAGALFFFLRKGFGSTVGYVVSAALLACVLALLTPLGGYFYNYIESDQPGTLSGRTLLWSAVLPAIRQTPIVGHGYLASMFVALEVNQVGWDAPHLHNAFVEVLYNNGLIGLILILIINVLIARNLIRVVRRAAPIDPVHRIGAGCLALYTLLLINGFFNASFGGRARPPFILLLSLVLISDKLLKLTSRPLARAS